MSRGRCTGCLEATFGNLDSALGYHTPRTLLIKDRYLGVTLLLLKSAILVYVLGYQMLWQQKYMALVTVETSVRFQVRQPDNSVRWPAANLPGTPAAPPGVGPPYCTGVTAVSASHPRASDYVFTGGPGTYTYVGPGAPSPPVPLLQRKCDYFDAIAAVPFPETDHVFITTEQRLTSQRLVDQANGNAPCSDQALPQCDWAPAESSDNITITPRGYVADVELFTVLIDHNLISLNRPDLSRTVADMSGRMLRAGGGDVDPCRPYAAGKCPRVVAVGVPGQPDIVSIATLLEAAGVPTLDVPSGARNSTNSIREGGLVLLLEVTYSNFFYGPAQTGSWNMRDVAYTFAVSAVPATEYKAETAEAGAPGATPLTRELFNRHGIRIILSTVGRVGWLDFQTMLVNLTVGLGLLAFSVVVVEFIAFSCCPLRSVYKQYKERVTVDMSELRRVTEGRREELRSLIERFNEDPFVVDPPPAPLAMLMRDHERLKKKRSGDADGAAIELTPVTATVKSNPLAVATAAAEATPLPGAADFRAADDVAEWAPHSQA